MDTCHASWETSSKFKLPEKIFSSCIFMCINVYSSMGASTVGSIPGWGTKIPHVTSVQSLSRIWLFVTPWTAARQASLSVTNSQSSLKLISIELVMSSNHLILCHPLLLPPSIFPSIRVFSNELSLHTSGQSIRASALAPVLPMNVQGWFPFDWLDIFVV